MISSQIPCIESLNMKKRFFKVGYYVSTNGDRVNIHIDIVNGYTNSNVNSFENLGLGVKLHWIRKSNFERKGLLRKCS